MVRIYIRIKITFPIIYYLSATLSRQDMSRNPKIFNFTRPPRRRIEVPRTKVVIPPPPTANKSRPKINYLQTIAPAIGAFAAGMAYGIVYRNLLFPFIMVISSTIYVSIMVYSKRREQKEFDTERKINNLFIRNSWIRSEENFQNFTQPK